MTALSPYIHAPRLPEQGDVELDSLLQPTGAPLELEIGPGRGMFALERLAARPEIRYLALEIRRKHAQILDERMRQRGWSARARSLAEDAKEALPRLRPDGAVQRVFLCFPDPWWKRRHSKRLVMGHELIEQLVRLLAPGGELFIETDVEHRAEEQSSLLALHPQLIPAGDEEGSFELHENPYEARSNREKRADEDGLPIRRMRWRRA